MASVEFRILGSLEAVTGGKPADLGAPKQRALLAVLLADGGRVVPRERLVDALWGEDPPASAVQSLQVYVHGLRRALGADRIETAGAGYRVVVGEGELDLDRFEHALEHGRDAIQAGSAEEAAVELGEALALWRGPALADLPHEARTAAGAERMEELRLVALELRNDAELACGRHQALVAELDLLVAEHPYRERFLEQRALALYRGGRQKEALEACRDARRTLADELGLEPTAALRELERAILRQDPALEAPAPVAGAKRSLPVPPTPLVGRHLEVAAVTALFREEGARLVTLTGPGGTGKTRLALAVAEALGQELRDGSVFVGLASISAPELVLPTIAGALGLQEGDRSLETAVGESLRGQRLLLVLDNFEQLLPAAPVVAELLASAPELLVLATSRAPLRLAAERDYPVPPFAVPDDELELEALLQTDAVRLFAARARAVDAEFRLDGEAARAVARICGRLDGLPLAIELAAARANLLAPAEMLERLEREPKLLGQGPRDAPDRQRTLGATIHWSYELLSAPERIAFARLGVFSGGCTIASADEVCEIGMEELGALVDNSLLRRRPQDRGAARFTMLETVRHYAAERLEEAGADELRRRHAEWLTDLAESAEAEIQQGGDTAAWLDRIEPEHDNVRSALTWSLVEAPVLALRLASALRIFWEIRGHFSEGGRWLEEALEAAADAPPAIRAKALAVSGTIAFRRGDLELSRERFEGALELSRKLDDATGIAKALSDLGTVAAAVDDLELAGELFAESARRFRELDEPSRLAIVLANVGHVSHQQGDYAHAIEVTEEAAAIQQRLGHKHSEAISLYNLGSSYLSAGELDRARRRLGQCVDVTFELGFKEVMAYALAAIVRMSLQDGDPERAAYLAGVGDRLLSDAGVSLQPREQELFDEAKATAEAELGDRYLAVHDAGVTAPLEDALVDAKVLARAGAKAGAGQGPT
jgi:predicted ATPase/DNA-binding SARP family transcriptional activator